MIGAGLRRGKLYCGWQGHSPLREFGEWKDNLEKQQEKTKGRIEYHLGS